MSSVDSRMFGMRTEELKEWLADVPDRLVLNWARQWAENMRLRFTRETSATRRPGEFICDRHWAEIKQTFRTADPIDAGSVVIGLVTALYLSGQYPEPKAVHHACCTLNDYGWRGILKRSRPSFYKEASNGEGRREGQGRAADR